MFGTKLSFLINVEKIIIFLKEYRRTRTTHTTYTPFDHANYTVSYAYIAYPKKHD